jgi:arylsulfatase
MLDTVRPWETLTDDEKRLFVRMAEVFAGYISYYDDRLGRIVDYLAQAGELDNTIIVVVSDNGSSGEGGPNGTFNEWRFFNGIADTTDLVLEHIDELGTPASNNHYNTGWAWALDTPFPYWKRWAGYEGGTADICLISWPARITPSDEVRHQYVHAVDVVPTLYDLLGITPPEVINGYEQLPMEGESFAAALTDASVPSKSTQFFTMLGQRAIYHEGWLACTVHPPLSSWGQFDQDEWELYHLAVDRSQSTNLADSEPDRLEAMKTLWFECADRYNGLPLDDRSALEQVLAERPRAADARDQFVFYPDCADVPESAGPMIPGRSYTIAAGVALDQPDAQGVLWAAGGVAGGHSLYVKDGRLHYNFNWVGTYLQDVVADRDLTPGEHLCVAEFVATGKSGNPQMPGAHGVLTLYVDAEQVGSGEITTQPGYFCLTGDGISVGRDSGSAVTPEYQAPFPFTGGMIDKVVVDLSGDRYIDHEATVRGWFLLD